MRSKKFVSGLLLSVAMLVVSGCAEAPSDQADVSAHGSSEAAPAAAEAQTSGGGDEAPGFTTSAAPGVAFAYRYAFSLPGDAISEVQHRHAVACEELGPDRCQVTGMDFRQDGTGSISARLDLMVAPSLAHRFGKEALDAVRASEGELADAEVTGENVGGQIDASQLRSAGLEAELARIERRLATIGLSGQERTALAARATELRDSLRGEQDGRMTSEKRLATTPMSFAYASKGLFASSRDPLGHAAANSLSGMEGTLAVILTLAGLLLPWFLLGGLLILGWKGLRRLAPAAAAGDSGGPPA